MFDNFFEKHKPESEAAPSAESVGRIDALLKGKLNETAFKEEKPMKKKSMIKRILLVAAAAAAAASALIFSATADYEGDEKYIVRINGKRVDAEVTTYWEGNIRFDTVVYELPCELFIDKDGQPVTEDSDVDRRVVEYEGIVYSNDDHEAQLSDPGALSCGGGCFDSMYQKNALQIAGTGHSGSNTLRFPVIIECHYNEAAVKEFWENYWKDPETESQKWAEKFEEVSSYREFPSKKGYHWADSPYCDEFRDPFNEMVEKYGLEEYYSAE